MRSINRALGYEPAEGRYTLAGPVPPA
jgi:hypothetical protein